MENKAPVYYDNVEACVEHIVDYFNNEITIESPQGLGKPVALLNALYQRAKQDPHIKLTIISSLSLEKPFWSNELQRRFIKPFVERVWFGVPDLLFLKDIRENVLPSNVRIYEFYSPAGQYVGHPKIQQLHICSNYTHIVRDSEILGANLFANVIAKSQTRRCQRFSMSCSADLSLAALKKHRSAKASGAKRLCIGQINSNLPFMFGDAEVAPELYDIVIDHSRYNHPLFAVPRRPISIADYMIGINVSALIRDGGTLRIGLGPLGDAIAYALDMRHQFNSAYMEFIDCSGTLAAYGDLIKKEGGTEPFEKGLYGATDMLVDGYLQLYKSGILKRKVYNHSGIQHLLNEGMVSEEITTDTLKLLLDEEVVSPYLSQKEFEALKSVGVLREDLIYDKGSIVWGEKTFSADLSDSENLDRIGRHCLGEQLKNGVIFTGGSFIGPKDFYETLKKMPREERRQFEMTGVETVNQLYGNETLRALQRRRARFCDEGMLATVLGHIVSDGFEDGTVINGVGGYYNFVSMSHALPDARSITMLSSTRMEKGKLKSNIVYNYGHITIPRHLRDIVVTEYGIADIRGLCDQDIIIAMLKIMDSRFQEKVLRQAKKHRKLPDDYRIPDQYRNNLPKRLADIFRPFKTKGYFIEFPHGTDLSPIEFGIARSLRTLNQNFAASKLALLTNLIREIPNQAPERAMVFLDRMQLVNPASFKEKVMQKAVVLSLRLAGLI